MEIAIESHHKRENKESFALEVLHPRHAKSFEPGNLVSGHFWSDIQTFFRNQRFKGIHLKLCCGFLNKHEIT